MACRLSTFLLYLSLASLAAAIPAASWPQPQDYPEDGEDHHWVAAWTSMPQLVEPDNMPPAPFNTSSSSSILQNSTLRQTLHLSLGLQPGSLLRIQLSNLFSDEPLPITTATLSIPLDGLAGASSLDPSAPIVPLTFSSSSSSSSSSHRSVTISSNQSLWTDPFRLPANFPSLPPQSNIAISLYLQQGQSGSKITGHPGSRTTSWFQHGDFTSDPAWSPSEASSSSTLHWYILSALSISCPHSTSALVILGDSLTDGRGSTDNANNRWPDFLQSRLLSYNITTISIVNQAAGGNAVLPSSDDWGLGPSLLDRLHRDLLAVDGAKWGFVLEGVNDIGGADPSPETQGEVGRGLEDAYREIVEAAAAAAAAAAAEEREGGKTVVGQGKGGEGGGIKMIAGTVMPFKGEGQVYWDPERERTRREINGFLLKGKGKELFDGRVVDFASVVADEGDERMLKREFDSGDHLHLNVAGYRVMAEAFPIEFLLEA